MITLRLYPSEFRVLIGYLRANTQDQDQVPLVQQSVHRLVLISYLRSFTVARLLIWKERRGDRLFKLSMPPVVALAMHQEMQSQLLTGHQQLLLNKLDDAVINYRSPQSQAHVIGELIAR